MTDDNGMALPTGHNTHIVLNAGRWSDYACMSARSIGCILISTVKNIYQSYFPEKVMLVPPDEKHIESIESLLQIEKAVEAFYSFIL